jgi:hypothetical protein
VDLQLWGFERCGQGVMERLDCQRSKIAYVEVRALGIWQRREDIEQQE